MESSAGREEVRGSGLYSAAWAAWATRDSDIQTKMGRGWEYKSLPATAVDMGEEVELVDSWCSNLVWHVKTCAYWTSIYI